MLTVVTLNKPLLWRQSEWNFSSPETRRQLPLRALTPINRCLRLCLLTILPRRYRLENLDQRRKVAHIGGKFLPRNEAAFHRNRSALAETSVGVRDGGEVRRIGKSWRSRLFRPEWCGRWSPTGRRCHRLLAPWRIQFFCGKTTGNASGRLSIWSLWYRFVRSGVRCWAASAYLDVCHVTIGSDWRLLLLLAGGSQSEGSLSILFNLQTLRFTKTRRHLLATNRK